MPELPEVETIVRELRGAITGKTLSRFSVFDTKRIARPRLALPQKVVAVKRHGKFIVCETEGDMRCLVHLRMTGELLFEDKKPISPRQKHERAAFSFSDGSMLRFLDVRRFGTIDWHHAKKVLPVLGPDPLSKKFTPEILRSVLDNSSRVIKSALLDQQIVAGIGNIYADESLWLAKIHPRHKAGSLLPHEATKLVRSIKQVLREGIKKGGFTLRDYRRIDGSFGHYQKSRKAYDREGLQCFRCRAKIKRIKIGGRSSYFCPRCQR